MEYHSSFNHSTFLFRKKIFKIFGASFQIFDQKNNVIFFSKQKSFKLKEDIKIYADESKKKELLSISTDQVLDFGAIYNVQCSVNNENIGSLKRKGLKSIFKDEWILFNSKDEEFAKLSEKSILSALVSRIIKIIPQKYLIISNKGEQIAQIKQHFNPFILKYTFNVLNDKLIDKRLFIATGVLLCAIEGRQN